MKYYAENELNKIRNEFNIEINEDNFDIIINYKKARHRNNNDNNDDNNEQDFQYVICYPNVRYYDWDESILNEKEKELAESIKRGIKISEENFILKNSIHSIIIFVLYLAIFFFLTVRILIMYYLLVIIFFSYTKIISFYLSNEYKKILRGHEIYLNSTNVNVGYLIILSSSIIHLFKLNPNEYYKGKNFYEIYKSFLEKTEKLNNKYSIFSY